MIRTTITLVFLTVASGFAAQQQPPDDVYINEFREQDATRIRNHVKDKNWNQLFNEYRSMLDDPKREKPQKVIRPAGAKAWTSIKSFYMEIFRDLPPDVIENYRRRFDGDAHRLFREARETDDLQKFEILLDKHFFSGDADEATLILTTRLIENGRLNDAAFHLERLLRYYPNPDVKKELVAARLLQCLATARNKGRLKTVAQWIQEAGIEGTVIVGRDKRMTIAEIAAAAASTGEVILPPPFPWAPPAIRDDVQIATTVDGLIRNEIRLFTYDFKEADEEDAVFADASTPPDPSAGRRPAPPEMGAIMFGERMTGQAGVVDEYPLLPAIASFDGKDVIVVTNGCRVAALDPWSGRTYWVLGKDFKSDAQQQNLRNGYVTGAATRNAYMGATIVGEYAFVTLRSPRPRKFDNTPNQFGYYEPRYDMADRMVCIRIYDAARRKVVRDVVWDTELHYAKVDLEKHSQNWSFSSPPLVRGDRLFVGVVAAPGNESESYVACLDRWTGLPLWRTFVCQQSGRFNPRNAGFGWYGTSIVLPLTLLADGGGLVYASSNQGAVAGLNPFNGSIAWLNLYPATKEQNQQMFARPPSNPVYHRGRLFVLPQDAAELLVYDAVDGGKLDAPSLPAKSSTSTGADASSWRTYSRILGMINDDLVVAGKGASAIFNLERGKAHPLADGPPQWGAAGCVYNGYVYMPTEPATGKSMAVFASSSWLRRSVVPWKENTGTGNLLVQGPYVLLMNDKLHVYTDSRLIDARFASRLVGDPPDVDALYEYGRIMKENQVWDKAADAMLQYLKVTEGIESEEAHRRAIANELCFTFLRRGDVEKAKGKEMLLIAIQNYLRAQQFASNPKDMTEATMKLAESYEALKDHANAAREYQRVLRKHPWESWVGDDKDTEESVWRIASRKIEALIKEGGEAIYAEVEAEVAKAIAGLSGDVKKLEELFQSFPNSKQLRAEVQKRLKSILESEAWQEAENLIRRLEDLDPKAIEKEVRQKLIDTLEKNEYYERAREELRKLRGLFGDGASGKAPQDVEDYVKRKLDAIEAKLARPPAESSTLDRLACLKPADSTGNLPGPATATDVFRRPLRPEGFYPPKFDGALEFLRAGSSVEMWNLAKSERVWSRARPGGYLGLIAVRTEEGLMVSDVGAGTPAAAAGIQKGDFIVNVGADRGTLRALKAAVAAAEPGKVLKLTMKRPGRAEREAELTVAVAPADSRPRVVGGAFTSGGLLVVAWEDQLAALDPKTGDVRWRWAQEDTESNVTALAWADGRLYAAVTPIPKAPGTPVQVDWGIQELEDMQLGMPEARAADGTARVVCLDDIGGRLLWSRSIGAAGSVSLMAGPGWDSVAVVAHVGMAPTGQVQYLGEEQLFLSRRSSRYVQPTAGGAPSLLIIRGRDGSLAMAKKTLDVYPSTYTIDVATKTLYRFDATGGNYLIAEPLPVESYAPAVKAAKRQLDASYGVVPNQGQHTYHLASWNDLVVFVSSKPELTVFKRAGETFEPVKKLDLGGRDVLKQPYVMVAPDVDKTGTLYVYAHDAGAGPQQNPNTACYLLPFDLKGDRKTAMGALYAPGVLNLGGVIETGLDGFVLFSAPQSRGGAQDQGQMQRLSVYAAKSKKLVSQVKGVELEAGNQMGVWTWRGRFYYRKGDRLTVMSSFEKPVKPVEDDPTGAAPRPAAGDARLAEIEKAIKEAALRGDADAARALAEELAALRAALDQERLRQVEDPMFDHNESDDE